MCRYSAARASAPRQPLAALCGDPSPALATPHPMAHAWLGQNVTAGETGHGIVVPKMACEPHRAQGIGAT